MHVSVVFVFLFYFIISCLYSAVSLTLVREQRLIRFFIFYFLLLLFLLLFLLSSSFSSSSSSSCLLYVLSLSSLR